MQKSIFTKYFSLCATLVFVSITILGTVFLIFASQFFKTDKYRLLESNVKRAAEIIEDYERRGFTLGGDLELGYFKNSLRALSEAIDASVFVTDSTGASLFCTEAPPCFHMEQPVPADIISALAARDSYSELGTLGGFYGDRYYTVAVPVKLGSQDIGYVFASSHASSQQQSFLDEMLKLFLVSAVVVLAVTFVAVYFISLQMVRPLRQMSEAAQKFGRGELDTRLEVTGYDEIGQLAMALNNMAQSLSTLEVTRRSFVANVSHELRTPMTSIAGFVDGILDGTIPPEKQPYYLRIVSDEVKRLSRLVRTMLNLSRLEAGEMQVNRANINIVDIICQTVFSFEQPIEKKRLEIRGLDRGKVMVDADPDLMHQVIYNLTENAVKFANEGGYLAFDFAVAGSRTRISVKNSGSGLSKEEIPKVFDRFYKTDRSRGLDKNGVGLGLYIVRSIVALHGGEIAVRSVEGEYTEFLFTVPSGGEHKTGNFKKN